MWKAEAEARTSPKSFPPVLEGMLARWHGGRCPAASDKDGYHSQQLRRYLERLIGGAGDSRRGGGSSDGRRRSITVRLDSSSALAGELMMADPLALVARRTGVAASVMLLQLRERTYLSSRERWNSSKRAQDVGPRRLVACLVNRQLGCGGLTKSRSIITWRAVAIMVSRRCSTLLC